MLHRNCCAGAKRQRRSDGQSQDFHRGFKIQDGKTRSEERRVGKECRYWRDWSSDVCSSDLKQPFDSLDVFQQRSHMNRNNFVNRKTFIVGILGAGCFIATAALVPSVSDAQMDKVKISIAALKSKTAKLDRKSVV